MNNIYTEIDTLLKHHLNESFEISELSDSPILSLSVLNGTLGTSSQNLSDDKIDMIIDKYKFNDLLTSMGIEFSIIGYVEKDEFFLFSAIVRGEEHEMSPERRAMFMELYNSNKIGIKLRHVPVMPVILSLPGAKNALERGNKYEDVAKYTIKAIVEQVQGISPMSGRPRKGFVMKSLTSNFAFKVYSAQTLLLGSL